MKAIACELPRSHDLPLSTTTLALDSGRSKRRREGLIGPRGHDVLWVDRRDVTA